MSGDYSVQMRRRQTHCERREQHFHHSPWERERQRMGEKWILATVLKTDRQTLSPEHLQCAQDLPSVCINKHHPATTRLVRLHVCRRSPLSPVQPPPPLLQSPPTGTETAAQTGLSVSERGGEGGVWGFGGVEGRWEDSDESVQPGLDAEQWGRDGWETVPFIYNQLEVFG